MIIKSKTATQPSREELEARVEALELQVEALSATLWERDNAEEKETFENGTGPV